MSATHAVVLGASAGGVESLREVVGALPADFPAPVFVVLHIPAYQASSLPEILNFSGVLHACHPEDGAKIETGRIYVAPPDHHLLIERERVVVQKGPKENRFRPSIDALFRSAAYNYGPKAIGVVLSGALDDGTSGLWTIQRLGGTTIVQEPNDARFESMPLSALSQVKVDHTVPAKEIGALLSRLVAVRAPAHKAADVKLRKRVEVELAIAVEGGAFAKGIMEMGELTPFTCPECHGVLVKLKEDKMTRYRCHTGHGYSDSALLEGVMESTGEMLWQVMRSLEEAVMIVEHMARQIENEGDKKRAKVYFRKAQELETRSKMLHEAVHKHESLSGDNLEDAAGR
jgi:two-component system chemotaxis response regulator CheB